MITYIQYASNEKNPPALPTHTKTEENDQLEAIKKLIESKFSKIEERINSVEQQIKSQKVEFVSLISKTEKSTKAAKLNDNLDCIDSNSFEVNQLKDRVSHLDEEIK